MMPSCRPVRCACIDIGSNTTRLLVAEPDGALLREVRQERAFTRIGAACHRDGTIPAEKVAEVAAVVAAYAAMARAEGVAVVRAVATAAIRRAPNREEFVAVVRELTGVEVDVLGGEEEARLAFLGATGVCPGADAAAGGADPHAPIAVVDVGGGSTEIVVGTPVGGVSWVVSVPVGSSVLEIPRLGEHGAPDPEGLELARERSMGAFIGVTPPPVTRAIAVGGSATSLRLLVGPELSGPALAAALAELAATTVDDVVLRRGLHPDRVRMLPAGLLILAAAGSVLGGTPLEIGRGGLREGVVLEHLLHRGGSGAQ